MTRTDWAASYFGVCGRPTKRGTPCQQLATHHYGISGGPCTTHLSPEEREQIEAAYRRLNEEREQRQLLARKRQAQLDRRMAALVKDFNAYDVQASLHRIIYPPT